MNLANAIEGGLTGAATLTLLQEALHKVDGNAPRPFLHKSGIIKQIKKAKKKGTSNKLYIKLAGELLSGVTYFGVAGLGKKKNVVLRGGLLGAAAGLGAAFLKDDEEAKQHRIAGLDDVSINNEPANTDVKNKILTVTLYTVGGLLAGAAIKRLSETSKGKKNKKSKGKNKRS